MLVLPDDEASVSKLISNADPPRVYICDECVVVCASILDDERELGTVDSVRAHPLLSHPPASSLSSAIERWIRRESLGGDSAAEFAEVRSMAVEMTKALG